MEDYRQYYTGKKTIITGGTGLIGRQVTRQLCDLGAKVTIVSLDHCPHDPRAQMVYGDLSDFQFCREITRECECLFHLAGIKGSVDVTRKFPASFFVPLLQMNTNILEAARIQQVEKVVYTSSIGAYAPGEVFVEPEDGKEEMEQPPMDQFPGWAKRMAELQVKAYRLQYGLDNFSVVRLSNVYGPGDNFDPDNAMVIPSLMSRVHKGENPLQVWGDGSAIRDFAYSSDIAEGILRAHFFGTRGQVVNLGSGEGITIQNLVETLSQITGCAYRFDPGKPGGFPRRIMNIERAREWLGFNPQTSLKDGLKITWEWFLENQHEYHQRKNYFKES